MIYLITVFESLYMTRTFWPLFFRAKARRTAGSTAERGEFATLLIAFEAQIL